MNRLCSSCDREYPATTEHFFRHLQRADGLHSWCKQCCAKGNTRSRAKLNSTIEGRARVFLQNAKKSALKRGHDFDLEVKDIVECWTEQFGICAYSGRQMTLEAGQLETVSIERIDSSIGYVKANVVLVCQAVNGMKSNRNFQDFFELCRDVARFLGDEDLNLSVMPVK